MKPSSLSAFWRTYRITLFAWILPLLAGVSIFLTWLATRWNWLMDAGVFTIFAGLILCLAGIAALPPSTGRQLHVDPMKRRGSTKQSFFCLMLLLSNVAVAAMIIAAVDRVLMSETGPGMTD